MLAEASDWRNAWHEAPGLNEGDIPLESAAISGTAAAACKSITKPQQPSAQKLRGYLLFWD
jgi:hypothetical protein